ncbi:hypothetical protein [Bacillus sp. FJAT-42315]|uniref:hypothetical protein n=1 Tax=Bacillus sp. FJAT-42315 TaxID=2014077 RepID=UPI000C23CCDE|nr:hypothetical protein [Bacillus sp. FJAT-42315]
MRGVKYLKLQEFLKSNKTETITLSFRNIEVVLGFTLPQSAYRHVEHGGVMMSHIHMPMHGSMLALKLKMFNWRSILLLDVTLNQVLNIK